jgi:hypothetical protein
MCVCLLDRADNTVHRHRMHVVLHVEFFVEHAVLSDVTIPLGLYCTLPMNQSMAFLGMWRGIDKLGFKPP